MRRTLTAIALGLALTLFGAMLAVAPAGAQAQDFVSLINNERAANGLAPLAVDGSLAGGAQAWSDHLMRDVGALAHDPNIASSVGGWTKLGENVGTGASVGMIWGAFMGSPQHRTNILDPDFTHVGVGVAIDINGQLWVTQRFMRSGSGAPSPPPVAVSPAPAPAPAPSPAPAPRPKPAPAPPSTTTPPTTAAPVEEPPPPAPASPHRVAIVLDALHQIDP